MEESEGRDPQGTFREAQGGGRSDRGPNADPGGEVVPGGLVPPYEGRSGERGGSESSEALTESVESQLSETVTGAHGSTASPAVESPVEPSEVSHEVPESPLGVGESMTRRGEDVAEQEGKEAGRDEYGTEHESGRPAGGSDSRDASGAAPNQGVTDSPPQGG
jgi:hypothetical protein